MQQPVSSGGTNMRGKEERTVKTHLPDVSTQLNSPTSGYVESDVFSVSLLIHEWS